MPENPRMRASDTDRDRAAALLREHHAAGRLGVEEFQERLDATFEAKTLADLDELMADLPGIDLYRLPEASIRRMQATAPAVAGSGRLSPSWRAAWGSWFSVNLVLFVIWLITSINGHGHGLDNLWFLWVAGPWGAILLGRWLLGGSPNHHHQVRGPRGGPARELGDGRTAPRSAPDPLRQDPRGGDDGYPGDF